jgi:hypothetical protein
MATVEVETGTLLAWRDRAIALAAANRLVAGRIADGEGAAELERIAAALERLACKIADVGWIVDDASITDAE